MIETLEHKFVETIPEEIDEGVLYISPRFRVIIHLCCCGCKNKVVTPLSPARWHMVFDGKTISLCPSIGNWNFECESHYWIENSKVVTASKWSKEKIKEGKQYEREKRAKHFDEVNEENNPSKKVKNLKTKAKRLTLLDRIKSFFTPKRD